MKKLILFTMLITMLGCTCIGQIPTQTIYVDDNCQVLLPDYLAMVTVSDNCDFATIEQLPIAGTILDAVNPSVEVMITVTDVFGNEAEMIFDVVAVDTIPPVITPNAELLTYTIEDVGNVLDGYRYMIGSQLKDVAEQTGDSTWITMYQTRMMTTFSAPPDSINWDSDHLTTWYPYTNDPISYVKRISDRHDMLSK